MEIKERLIWLLGRVIILLLFVYYLVFPAFPKIKADKQRVKR
jgi:F0F1-type ATP synthase membrane subunit b/b'